MSAIESSHRALGAWSSLTPEQRADTMARAMAGFASRRDADVAILFAEVGKILHAAWIDHLVFEIRWNLALALSGQVDLTHTLLPESGLPVESTVARLNVGYVWVNDHGAPRLDLRAPFGGMKHSGFGREQGLAGIRAFQDTRVVARERTSP